MGEKIDLNQYIRKFPDYPDQGILFFDITGILINPVAFTYCVESMLDLYKDKKIDAVAGIESRGFLFAAPFAERRGVPLILVRKAGKLPGPSYKETYHLEYGESAIEIHKSDLNPGLNILLIDDLIATGGTLRAACNIIERGGSIVNNIFGAISLPFLDYREKLPGIRIDTLIDFHDENI